MAAAVRDSVCRSRGTRTDTVRTYLRTARLLTLALVLVFVIGDPLGLLGAVFAVPVLALMTGKVPPRGRRVRLLSMHR